MIRREVAAIYNGEKKIGGYLKTAARDRKKMIAISKLIIANETCEERVLLKNHRQM